MIRQLCAACAILIATGLGCLVAAPRSRSIEVSQQLDSVYARFQAAYDALDPSKIAELYTEDARYLIGQDRLGVLRGRDDVVATFAHLFEWARSEGATLEIEFAIDQREIADTLAYDVGSYRLKIKKPDSEEAQISTGKFTTVFRFDSDHTWRFVVDSWSAAPNATFDDLLRRSASCDK